MKSNIVFAGFAYSVASLVLLGCGDDNNNPGPADGGGDAAETGFGDALSIDAARDASADAATDAGVDAEDGAVADTGSDAGADATIDAGGDAGVDAGGADAEADATTDAAPDSAEAGDAGEAGALPAPPSLGMQIDRLGRPAINTALNHTFDTNTTTQGAAKDAYNADRNPADWGTYIPQFEMNLAIYDSLDTICGNQAAYNSLGNPAYATLATVLSADELWVNTGSTVCQQYLGVEFNVLGIANTDCGGRTPSENVIDVTYNALAGTIQGTVTNGVTAPSSPPSTTFPYLAAPH